MNSIPECRKTGQIEQFVMAYGVEHDRLRAILPEGDESLRPVIRINAEIRDGSDAYVEVNTAIGTDGKRGWRNIKVLKDVQFEKCGSKTTFRNDELEIYFARVGIQGGCPAEKDNEGCFYKAEDCQYFVPAEKIDSLKEFCDCSFRWLTENGASGESVGETLPAIPEAAKHAYPSQPFNLASAAIIPCRQVLGSYAVEFERK